jgi:bacterioferritin
MPAESKRSVSMKGNKKVIDVLNQVLRKELTGINQYFIHAKMCENGATIACAA